MTNFRLFLQLRNAFRFECSYQRAVSNGFVGDRMAWLKSYPTCADLRWNR